MAEVKLVNVKKIYPFVSGEEKKSKKKKKGEEPAEEKKVNLQITDKGVVIVVPTTDIDLDAVHGSHKPVKYSFKPELMHFFDKETEKNLF